MKNLQAILLTPNTTIEATLQAIDQGAVGAALIVMQIKNLRVWLPMVICGGLFYMADL